MANLRPMRIPGRWKDGFVLDFHTVSSVYLGDDQYGHPVFDTTRSELGDLLYRLKYRSDNTVTEELVATAVQFLRSWNPDVGLIVPVPPSQARTQQPVLVLADGLGKRLGVEVRAEGVTLLKDIPQIKNVFDYDERLRILEGAYNVDPQLVSEQKVLLFDDLYRSGATMNAITSALYEDGHVQEVYALAITRTRSRT